MIFSDDPASLAEISSRILRSPWAAVDTEADSLHHYSEKLSLLQISIENEDFVIVNEEIWNFLFELFGGYEI